MANIVYPYQGPMPFDLNAPDTDDEDVLSLDPHPQYTLRQLEELYGGTGKPDLLFPLWRDIQDIVGPAKLWPHAIREFMWTRNLRNWPRTRLAAFCWINGLPIAMLLHWGIMIQMWKNPNTPGFRHISRLLRYIEAGKKYNLFAWNVSRGRSEYLDGTPHSFNKA